MIQTREVVPGETYNDILRAMILGQHAPWGSTCPESIHEKYQAQGPDGKMYPTWHPPFDREANCFFDHEHGSDPHSFVGFQANHAAQIGNPSYSGLPLFGYTSARAGRAESHKGYKVFVTNNDLNGHAWMITLNQDTNDPGRAMEQFHTVDWQISSLEGEILIDIHMLADFGFAIQNCSGGEPLPGSEKEPRYTDSGHPRRTITTTNCARKFVYERWDGVVQVGDIFEAKPMFEVDNPATVIDPHNPNAFHPSCAFRPIDEGCDVSGNLWSGNKRTIFRPGQRVQNDGPEYFTTDPTGRPVREDDPRAIVQFVAHQSWDNRQCCGNEVVFRIQTYSGGIFVADPREPAGSAEFGIGDPPFYH